MLLVAFVVLFLLLVLFGMALYQVLIQNGRILARLDAVEARAPWDDARLGIEAYVANLPAGVPAPAIQLPDLGGVQRTLSEWRGRRVLLVFMDPNCVFSRRLLPSLVALMHDPVAGRPEPVIISTGDLEANRNLFDAAGFTNPVLLQEATEVAGSYKVDGTPMAYLINADGTIAAEIAVGIQAILLLAGDIAAVSDATATEYGPAGAPDIAGTASVRSGLPVGATAPLFRLPRLDGGELSLLDYRGRSLVLVFFDPDCPPCDELAPLLQAAHDAEPGLAIAMISRGDPAETAAKSAEFGFTFPIGMQRHWEISREYGIFANPAAFHIDEWGTIGAEVAIGPERVMALVHAAVNGAIPEQLD
ncbi:MAG: peroxiredoxin family protein [Dehalococcoidia bacterium]